MSTLDEKISEELARAAHRNDVKAALTWTVQALKSAYMNERRTDCLRVAVQAIQGALNNVEYEDVEYLKNGK